jgi:uncharacterized protein YndB with AHSA1/START domain
MSEDRIERDILIAAPLDRVWSLAAEPDKTRLRVVESGFAALVGPEELRHKAAKGNTGGWPQVFDALKTRAERSSA